MYELFHQNTVNFKDSFVDRISPRGLIGSQQKLIWSDQSTLMMDRWKPAFHHALSFRWGSKRMTEFGKPLSYPSLHPRVHLHVPSNRWECSSEYELLRTLRYEGRRIKGTKFITCRCKTNLLKTVEPKLNLKSELPNSQ